MYYIIYTRLATIHFINFNNKQDYKELLGRTNHWQLKTARTPSLPYRAFDNIVGEIDSFPG